MAERANETPPAYKFNPFANVPRTLTGMLSSYAAGPMEITGLVFSARETPAVPSATTKFAWVRDNGDLLAGATLRTTALTGHSVEFIALHHRIGKADALVREMGVR